jgi:anti-sigma regulatory factor (Ser/Thr protein kinase)
MTLRTKYWTCQALGWGIYSAVGLASAAERVGWRPSLAVGYGLFAVYSIALTDLFRREIGRRRWLDAGGWRMVGALAAGTMAVATIQTFLVVAVDAALRGGASSFLAALPAILWLWTGVTGATGVWTVLYVTLTAERRSKEKEVRYRLAVSEAELRALEAQINPHFLFNCLNSIRGLVPEDPALAQEMITRFANILRYNLRRDAQHTVPLASEVAVVEDYLALEAVRLEERLKVQMAIEPEAAAVEIPPMVLQSLVENAVKHGIAPRPEGGELRVAARIEGGTLVVEVENPGRLGGSHPDATGVGLANTRERLRILYGTKASLKLEERGGRVRATATIPRPA